MVVTTGQLTPKISADGAVRASLPKASGDRLIQPVRPEFDADEDGMDPQTDLQHGTSIFHSALVALYAEFLNTQPRCFPLTSLC